MDSSIFVRHGRTRAVLTCETFQFDRVRLKRIPLADNQIAILKNTNIVRVFENILAAK